MPRPAPLSTVAGRALVAALLAPVPARALAEPVAVPPPLSPTPVRAVDRSPGPWWETLGERWRWTRFGVEDGLGSSAVLAVVEAVDGTAWAGTSGGVSWYDGYFWHEVDVDAGSRLRSLSAHPAGGVVAVFRKRVLHVTSEGGAATVAPEPEVLAVLPTRAGRTLVVGRDAAWWSEGGSRASPAAHPGAGLRAWTTASGRVLLQSAWSLLALDGATSTRLLDSRSARAFLRVTAATELDGPRGLASVAEPPSLQGAWEWAATSRGIQVARVQEGLTFLGVGLAEGGRALLVHESGELRCREADGAAWHALDPPSDDFMGASAVLLGSDRRTWVATRAGLFLHDGASRRWTVHRHDVPDGRNAVQAILLRRDGEAWLGTRDGIEILTAGGGTRHVDAIDGRPLASVTALAEDGQGDTWVGSGASFEGAYRWDGARWTHFDAGDGLAAPRVHAIHVDRQGRPWFLGLAPLMGHGEPGAFVLDGGTFAPVRAPGPELAGRTYDMADDSRGVYWFATGAGLFRLERGRWQRWTGEDGLPSDRVFAVAVDRRDRPWFSCQVGGLGTIEQGSVRMLSEAHGLLDDEVWDIAVDGQGALWVTTTAGLSRYAGGTWSNLDTRLGLPGPRLWPVAIAGSLVHVGTGGRGLAVLDTSSAGRAPVVVVDRPHVEQSSVHVRWRARARAGEQPPGTIETRCRLGDGPWSRWSTEREAVFRDVRLGRHEIAVQAKGILGALSDPALATAEVAVPPWLRPIVWLPTFGLLLALLMLLARELGRRRTYSRELTRRERRFAHILDGATDAIFTADLSGRLTSVNAAGERLTGRSREEIPGLRIQDFLTPESAALAVRMLEQKLEDGRPTVYEVETVRPDGERHVVEISTRIAMEDGQPGEVHGVGRDVTERRRVEEKVRQGHKLESLGLLAGGIAHDFNNLLQALIGNVALLERDGPLNASQREAVERIDLAARRATELTRVMLAYSGRGQLEHGPVDLSLLARDIASLLEATLPKDVQLRRELAEDLPPVWGDRAQLQQVVMNLVANAADALEGQPGTITIRTGAGRLDAAMLKEAYVDAGLREGPCTWLEVSDTGCGMDVETRQRIFDPFFTTKRTGRGLGLSAALGSVRAHRGALKLHSEPGRGTTFTLLFSPAARDAAPAPADEAPGDPAVLEGRRVLLADDDDRVRAVTARLLANSGCVVLSARDGLEAVEVFEREPEGVDAVVLDVVMPRLSGVQALARIRELDATVPVLVTSGCAGEEPPEATIEGRARFLAKPFRAEQLVDALASLLKDPPAVRRDAPRSTCYPPAPAAGPPAALPPERRP